MSNVRALRTKDISPRIVVTSVLDNVDRFAAIYIVALTDKGEPEFYASGDLTQMCLASKVFDDFCLRYIRGEIDEERP